MLLACCSCISKDNKNSANHNWRKVLVFMADVVLASAKIIKIQLITTQMQMENAASLLFLHQQR